MNVSVGVAFPDRLRLKSYAVVERWNVLRVVRLMRIYTFEETSCALFTVLEVYGSDVLVCRQFRLVNYRSFYITREWRAFSWEKSEGADLKDFMDEFYLILLQTAFGLKCVVMSWKECFMGSV